VQNRARGIVRRPRLSAEDELIAEAIVRGAGYRDLAGEFGMSPRMASAILSGERRPAIAQRAAELIAVWRESVQQRVDVAQAEALDAVRRLVKDGADDAIVLKACRQLARDFHGSFGVAPATSIQTQINAGQLTALQVQQLIEAEEQRERELGSARNRLDNPPLPIDVAPGGGQHPETLQPASLTDPSAGRGGAASMAGDGQPAG